MSKHHGWFEAYRNEDGSISAGIPKDWPEEVKTNFEKSVDLWIARGAELERERIIKLLEDNANHFQIGGGYEGAYDMALGLIKGEEWAIALIKEEQK